MSLIRRRQPFYQKDIHNSSFYHNHRYFGDSRVKTEETSCHSSLHREFVQLPQPFGIEYTYQYLRKANMQCIPDLKFNTRLHNQKQNHRIESKTLKLTRLSTNLFGMESCEDPILKQNESRSIQTVSYQQPAEHICINVLLYDKLDCPVKNNVELDLMKYITGCFLKCELRLDHMTVEQFRLLLPSIPNAIINRCNSKSNSIIPQFELGFKTIKSTADLIQRFLDFRDCNKQEQISRLLNYYIIPDDEVLDYQLHKLLNDINIMAKRMLNQQSRTHYVNLYIFNGNSLEKVNSIYELDTDMPIVAAQHEIVEAKVIIKYRQTLLNKYRDRRFSSFHNKLGDGDHEHPHFVDAIRLNLSYNKAGKLLEQKQKSRKKYRSRIKYRNPLLQMKTPFVDKSKLVREPSIFE